MITIQIKRENRNAVLRLPCRESEMEAALKRIRENDSGTPEPLIAKIVPSDLAILEGRYVNLDELNYLAKRMESFSDEELLKFYSAAVYEQYADMEDLINLTFNLHCYTLIRDVSSMEKVGRTWMFDLGDGVLSGDVGLEEMILAAKELLSSENLIPTAYGLLYKNQERMERIYDGRVFPHYAYLADWQWDIALEYHGRTEYLFLPDEEQAIRKAVARLGAAYPEDCQVHVEISNVSDWGWNQCLEEVRKKEGLFELNELMQAVNPKEIDIEKLSAVIRFAEADSALEMIRLTEHLDAFEFIRDADDEWDIGRVMLEKELGSRVSETLADYFDFAAFGEAVAQKYDGEFIDGVGYVYLAEGRKLDEILHPEEDIGMGGM